MIKVWILIVFSTSSWAGGGFTHTFYKERACEDAARVLMTNATEERRFAYCQEDQIPLQGSVGQGVWEFPTEPDPYAALSTKTPEIVNLSGPGRLTGTDDVKRMVISSTLIPSEPSLPLATVTSLSPPSRTIECHMSCICENAAEEFCKNEGANKALCLTVVPPLTFGDCEVHDKVLHTKTKR